MERRLTNFIICPDTAMQIALILDMSDKLEALHQRVKETRNDPNQTDSDMEIIILQEIKLIHKLTESKDRFLEFIENGHQHPRCYMTTRQQ